MKYLAEIPAITLATGARDRFHRPYVEEALPDRGAGGSTSSHTVRHCTTTEAVAVEAMGT